MWDRTGRAAAEVIELESAPSTNAVLAERARAAELPHLTVLLTRHQTAGRGRLDRVWTAPPGASLAVSVLLRTDGVPFASRGWIPLIAGAAMARAAGAQLPGHRVGAKWPNDTLVDGRKICGILAEGTESGVIVGSGINTRMTAEQLPVPTAASFAALGVDVDEDALLADYLGALDGMLAALAAAGGDADAAGVRQRVIDSCVTLGQEVRVMMPEGTDDIVGTAVSLSHEGHLVVAAAEGDVAVSAGDVVHVRPA